MAENNENFDDISKKKDKSQKGGFQRALRVISVFPCFPKYEPKPDTPNIDQVT